VNRPPKGEPWIWLTRDALRSPAWRALGINARRLIDFLMIEHMSHGGKRNGYLLAPREQLEEFGIGHRHITAAIEEAKAARLIDVKRGTGRRPSTFALTWLTVAGSEGDQQSYVAGSESDPQGGPKGHSYGRSRVRRDTATAQIKGVRRDPPLKRSYQGRGNSTGVYGNGHAAEQAAGPAHGQPGGDHEPDLDGEAAS